MSAEDSQASAAAPEPEMSDSRLHCRFYENQFPEVDDLVMVNVRSIAAMGAYVSLLEYNNIEGMILLSELSRRRIRSINKLIRVGKNEVVMVLRVDKEKGYIDLSKRRVSREDIALCEQKYNKAKAVHSVLRHVAETRDVPLERMYRQLAWPLYGRFGHAYDAFKLSIAEPERIFEGLTVDEELLTVTQQQIRRRLTPQPVKIRGDIEVTCFNYEGINAVREALQAAEAASTPEMPVTVKLIAPPMYVVTTSTLERDAGVELLNTAIAAVGEVIGAKGGSMRVKMAPKAVSQREETELNAMMERLELENREVDGDAEEES